MIEAYKIGVELALTGNVASAVAQLSKDFEALNRVVQQVHASTKEMATNLEALERIGSSAASAWQRAAGAMERATRAAGGTARIPGPGVGPVAPPMPRGGARAPEPPYEPTAPYPLRSPTPPRPGRLMIGYDDNPNRVNSPPEYEPIFPAPNGFTMGPDEPSTRARTVGQPYAGALVPISPGVDLIRPGSGGAMVPGGHGGPPPIIPLFPNGYPQPGPSPERPGMNDYMMAGAGMGMVAKGGEDFLSAAMRAHIEQEVIKSSLKLQGFTPDQVDRADTTASRLQRDVPSVTVGGGLELIRDMQTISQKPEEALNYDALKALAQTGVVLKSLGKGDEMASLFKAMQAGELRGALTNRQTGEFDLGTFQKFLDNVQTTAVVTGGRVGPEKILQTLKSMGVAGGVVSADTLTSDLITPILSLDAGRAGTGIKAFFQQFVSGKMSEGAGAILAESGMLNLPADAPMQDHQKLVKYMRQHYKVGMGQFQFPPGVMPNADEAATHPFDFIMQRIVPAADKYNADHHVVSNTPDELMLNRQKYFTMMSSREPSMSLIGEIARQVLLVQRDRTAVADARDRFKETGKSPIETVTANDPRIQIDAFHAAMNALLAQLGGTVMKDALDVLKGFTHSLNAVTDWAKANPGSAATLVRFAEGLTLVSGALAAAAGTLMVVAPMITIARFALARGAAASAGAGVASAGFGSALAAGAGAASDIALGIAARASPAAAFAAGIWGGGLNNSEDDMLHRIGPDGLARAAQSGTLTTSGFNERGRPASIVPPPPPAAAPADPNAVQNVRIVNPRDLANGVANGIARGAALPSAGTTFSDPRATPDLGLLGVP